MVSALANFVCYKHFNGIFRKLLLPLGRAFDRSFFCSFHLFNCSLSNANENIRNLFTLAKDCLQNFHTLHRPI